MKESRIKATVITILTRMIRDDKKKCCITVLDVRLEEDPHSYSRFFKVNELNQIESFLEEYAFHGECNYIHSIDSDSDFCTSVVIVTC